jgi:hypothetical protein
MSGNNFFSSFRGDVAIYHPGPSGQLDIDQRLGEARAQAAYFADLNGRTMALQGSLQRLQYGVASRGLAAQGSADSDPGSFPGGEGLPTAGGLGD